MSRELQEPLKDAWEEVGQILDTECSSVEDIRLDLEKGEKGGVKQSIENCMTVFYRDPLLKGAICKNELTCRIDIVKDMGWKRNPSASITDVDMFQTQRYLERNYGLKSERNINKAINLVFGMFESMFFTEITIPVNVVKAKAKTRF